MTPCRFCRRTARYDNNTCLECSYVPNLSSKPLNEAYERQAVEDAGDAAGALLDGWGNTNLALLTREQWLQFITLAITSFGDSIRRQVANNAPPF